MITINGQKMGKSLGNFITLDELFTGSHKMLEQAFSPMTIRFFILQAHYRSTLDFSNEALRAAEKGMERLLTAIKMLQQLPVVEKSTFPVADFEKKCYEALNDDLNSPVLIAQLFEGVRLIHSIKEGKDGLNAGDMESFKKLYELFVTDILGLKEQSSTADDSVLNSLVDLILDIRVSAKGKKDFQLSDHIRDNLTKLGFEIKDTKDGYEWTKK
jgi:cysteinyl-tRNA synthetase